MFQAVLLQMRSSDANSTPPTTLNLTNRRPRHRSPLIPLPLLPGGRRGRASGCRSSGASASAEEFSKDQPADPLHHAPIPAWKRLTDLTVILLALPVVVLLALIVYCWIKAVSPGPVLFRQTRVGRGGRRFTLYKFRSMHQGSDTGLHKAHVENLVISGQPMVKLDVHGDPRVIRGGRLLRTSGLDEIPQFFNILRGEMSMVGPRPCLTQEFDLYHFNQLQRFTLPPGLTGHWQVNRTDSTTFGDMVRMDGDYAERLTPWRDWLIICKTPYFLLLQTTSVVGLRRPRKAAVRNTR